ncbi:MAG: hypothetical protein WBX16_26425, partial [Candidatus Acidiferrales bacterium]
LGCVHDRTSLLRSRLLLTGGPLKSFHVTFTAWDILPSSTGKEPHPSDFLPLVKSKTCTGDAH